MGKRLNAAPESGVLYLRRDTAVGFNYCSRNGENLYRDSDFNRNHDVVTALWPFEGNPHVERECCWCGSRLPQW